MKPTSDDFKPRRDGYFEHAATWGEVTVGTIIAARDSRKSTWEVIDYAMGPYPIEPGRTGFFRVRSEQTGEEHTLQPRHSRGTCVILTRDPATTEPIPPTEPSDAEAIWLLVETLGAELLATRDNVTGEIVCPDYTYKSHLDGDGSPQPIARGLVEHMKFAHSMDVDPDLDIAGLIVLHGQAHNVAWPNIGKGGFPHRHIPEEDLDKDFVLNRRIKGLPIYVTPQEAQ